ncbi:MAG: DUF4253 domain-containing protein [Oscillospiraceae bacterium]|nr:DUF4253 domain-containing protein [Oscillospiraceae bacterium]
MSKVSKSAQAIIDYLGCEYVYIPKGSELSAVNSAYNELFAKREAGGYTPIIFAVDSSFEDRVMFDNSKSRVELQKEVTSAEIDAAKWFRDALTRWKEEMGGDWDEVVGEVADGEEMRGFSGMRDYGTGKSMECVIAKIPVINPWEIFAWFPFGGWNECPMPEEMFRICKYWYEKYGAVPALMTHDVLEFAAHPVTDKAAALDLAMEQFAFCSDIVFQGIETIGRLADSLTKSSIWYFWWD